MSVDLVNFTGAGDAPKGVTTDKTCYQSRMGVRPTTTANMAFKNSAEGGLMPLQVSSYIAPFTQIEGRMPNAMERGVPSAQGSKGA